MFAEIVWNVGNIAILVVVILAIIGLVIIASRQFGVAIPQWVYQVLGICFVAFVIILAIKFVLSL
jgi:hypothetical protein